MCYNCVAKVRFYFLCTRPAVNYIHGDYNDSAKKVVQRSFFTAIK